jgi:hypothetical protein
MYTVLTWLPEHYIHVYSTYMVTRKLHICIQYLHGYQNTTYMYTVLTWLPEHYIHVYSTYMVTRTLHTCIQYIHGYQNTTYMYTVLTCTHIYMGHSTELVKTGGGIKKRIFSLFAYMHYAHYVYFCVHHVFVK